MNYYTETIPVTLAEKLKEKGMPLGNYVWLPNGMASSKKEANLAYYDDQLVPYCNYAEVFDWLESNSIGIGIKHHWSGIVYQGWDWNVCQFNTSTTPYFGTFYGTWHEAANAAIEKALELIMEE